MNLQERAKSILKRLNESMTDSSVPYGEPYIDEAGFDAVNTRVFYIPNGGLYDAGNKWVVYLDNMHNIRCTERTMHLRTGATYEVFEFAWSDIDGDENTYILKNLQIANKLISSFETFEKTGEVDSFLKQYQGEDTTISQMGGR